MELLFRGSASNIWTWKSPLGGGAIRRASQDSRHLCDVLRAGGVGGRGACRETHQGKCTEVGKEKPCPGIVRETARDWAV